MASLSYSEIQDLTNTFVAEIVKNLKTEDYNKSGPITDAAMLSGHSVEVSHGNI